MLPWATIAALSCSNPHLANSGEDVLIKVCSRTTIVACVNFSRQEGREGEGRGRRVRRERRERREERGRMERRGEERREESGRGGGR